MLQSQKESKRDQRMTKIEDDLGQARAQLRQTLEQINQKVETAGSTLIPSEAVVWVKPILSVCLAVVVGFATGMADRRRRAFGVVAMGVLIGFSGRRSLSWGDSRCE